MRVDISTAARRDIEEITDFIARDNPASSVRLGDELLDKCLGLGRLARLYPLVPRYERFGIRRRPLGRYLIFYRVGEDHVTIIRIAHSARDYHKLLFSED